MRTFAGVFRAVWTEIPMTVVFFTAAIEVGVKDWLNSREGRTLTERYMAALDEPVRLPS
jgi:hypothetical protein